MLNAEISLLIMRMRKNYGERRLRLRRSLCSLCSSSARRERSRKGKITSTAMLKAKMIGYFQEEERRDRKSLDEAVSGDGADLMEALMCLQEACTYLDIMIRHPVMMGTPRYRKWSECLDNFLNEMRDLVDYRKKPGHHSTEVEEILIMKLRDMKIHEDSAAQKEVRFQLEVAMQKIFEPRVPDTEEIRKRLMGL